MNLLLIGPFGKRTNHMLLSWIKGNGGVNKPQRMEQAQAPAVVVDVAPSPKSMSYKPSSDTRWWPLVSLLLVLLLLLLALLISRFTASNFFIASFCIAASFLLFHMVYGVLRIMPVFIHKLSSIAYISERELKRIERAPALRFCLSAAIALTALYIASSVLVQADALLDTDRPFLTRSWEYFYHRFVQLSCIAAWLLFAEKYCIQKIAIYFHTSFYAKRLEANEFMLNCIGRLRILFTSRRSITPVSQHSGFSFMSSEKEYGTEEDAKELTAAVFNGLSISSDRDYLTIKDLEAAFQGETGRFMELLDSDSNGELSRKELQTGIVKAYSECELLETSLISNSRVINRLERMFLVLLVVVLFYICISMLMASLLQTISILGAGLVAANFLFAEEISAMFSGIIFVIITHPFDIGDIISIDGKGFRVQDIDLTLTTLQGRGGRFTYINNSVLADNKIGNVRRSGNMQETFKLAFESSATTEQLQEFEKQLVEFVHEQSRDYEGHVHLHDFVITNSKTLEFEVKVKHRANFQDSKVRNRRSRKMVNAIRSFISKANLHLAEFSWDTVRGDAYFH